MWLPDDTEWALVWQEAQDDACSGCGHPRSETMDPKGPDYEAVPLRCRACEAREAKAAGMQQAEGSLHGMKFAVTERGGD